MAQSPTVTTQSSWSIPSDSEIHRILVERIDTQKQGVGLVVGVIDPKGRRIISYGALNQGNTRPLDGNTEFEIGSITKVFTSPILADMVQHGEVLLDDPMAKYLPPTVKMPGRNGKEITLIDLSTHHSGLPRLPTNMTPKDRANPYADYTVDQMYQFLSDYTLTRDPGGQFEYSNLGGGLLGHVLSLRAGTDYESLVRRRILVPLGMKDTAITLSADMSARLAAGHDASLNPVKNWDVPTLAGAGALRSTANDLLKFLGAELGIGNSRLKASMARQLSVRRSTDAPNIAGAPTMAIALGWLVRSDAKGTVIWHNGGTGGYRTYIGFNPATRTGIVVLSNTSTLAGPDDIGQHLLIGTPLAEPVKALTEIPLDLKAKQAFIGQYQLAANFILTITLEGDQLFAQATGQPKFPAFPEGPNQLFLKVVNAQMTFAMDPDGRAASVILHQNGRDIPAPRIP
jgi:D-alanyl-D-alanine-carboxypeptidase/D-alanyl-D-alanine-endopeptidase